MHDIKAIRADPAAFDAALARRGAEGAAASLVDLNTYINFSKAVAESQVAEQRALGQKMGQLNARLPHADNDQRGALLSQINTLREQSILLKHNSENIQNTLPGKQLEYDTLLTGLPNIAAPDVPDGPDESANVIVHTHGAIRDLAFKPLEHDTIALKLGYDPEAAVAISGARFAVLKGPLARLHRALGQYMIDRHVDAGGYTEVAPPVMVRADALFGTAQLPKFEEDLFKTTGDNPYYLIPTAEVSLTNLVREQILDEAVLPLRFTALTPCFRAEAGSAGRDTRGLIRQHQFDKVELVSIVTPDQAEAEHERMTAHAEAVLDALGLPFRRMLLCAGDMGFAARKTYDLEVWLPGQGAYREISSCSDCGDFQARRMNARFRIKGAKGTTFVHTLNGSALAVGRTLVAVIENYQQADGSVTVPEVLLPYMGGVTTLTP